MAKFPVFRVGGHFIKDYACLLGGKEENLIDCNLKISQSE